MPIDTLKAVQIAAKLRHARRRIDAICDQVGYGVPDPQATGREFVDTLRYLRAIEEELARALGYVAGPPP